MCTDLRPQFFTPRQTAPLAPSHFFSKFRFRPTSKAKCSSPNGDGQDAHYGLASLSHQHGEKYEKRLSKRSPSSENARKDQKKKKKTQKCAAVVALNASKKARTPSSSTLAAGFSIAGAHHHIQPCAFPLHHLQLSRRPGNLFTPVKSKPKKPTWCSKPWRSNMHAAWCIAAHASLHHLHVDLRKPQAWWLLYSFEVRTNATAVVSIVKRILFLLFWERRRNRQRALRDLTCSFGGLVTTIDEAYQWLAVKAAVRCRFWLWMQPTINTTLSPKAYRCLKQAHRRRIEDTPLPFPTQARLNACQLKVCMIYSVQQ